MKIKGRTLAEIGADVLGGSNQAHKKRGLTDLNQIAPDNQAQDATDIDVSKTVALRTSLDPQSVEEDRKAKFERIKKAVQSGTYEMPSSEDLALAVGDAISFEVLSGGSGGV